MTTENQAVNLTESAVQEVTKVSKGKKIGMVASLFTVGSLAIYGGVTAVKNLINLIKNGKEKKETENAQSETEENKSNE